MRLSYSSYRGAVRAQVRVDYMYDPAGNLNWRTNNALVQSFLSNPANELTKNYRTSASTLTVAGTTTSVATNVTVNGSPASLYNDYTFALGGFSLVNGTNPFTAIAQDSYGRADTNTVSVNLPATNNYVYDKNGNLPSDGPRAFDYDDENELIRVTVTNAWKSEFAYDGKLRRRVRKEYTWQGGAWAETNEVRYVYDGMLVVQERDMNNLPTVSYTRGSDLSGSLQGAGGIGGLLARTDMALLTIGSPLSSSVYHSDGNGNVTMLINAENAAVAKYVYDPFGNTLSKSGPLAEANVYRFSGKEWNENAVLYYYGYRFYEPNLQRWVNTDPLAERGFATLPLETRNSPIAGANLYTFVRNAPTIEVDGFGLSLWVCLTPAFGIHGFNHAYLWDDSDNPAYKDDKCKRGCAMQKSSGSGPTQEGNCTGPPGGLGDGFDTWYGEGKKLPVTCYRVPDSNGKESKPMDCCRTTANNRVFLPPFSDCHNAVDDCLKGFAIPRHPRTGYPYSPK